MFGLYEPVRGSVPDMAGTGGNDPAVVTLSAALTAGHPGHHSEGAAVRGAVATSVAHRRCTPGLGGTVTARQAGEAIRAALGRAGAGRRPRGLATCPDSWSTCGPVLLTCGCPAGRRPRSPTGKNAGIRASRVCRGW
ncbi:isocitrate/isopropylmalate family dehydrogenase [Streptomyces sp. NPDC004457]